MIQQRAQITNGNMNKLQLEDRTAHDWYRFVLAYPPHLVRNYLDKFGVNSTHCVLDPFCGTGTTLVECKKLGIKSVGIEAHPFTCFASKVKTNWSPDPDRLQAHVKQLYNSALAELANDGIEDSRLFDDNSYQDVSLRTLATEQARLLLKDSISPLPLHKVLLLLATIEKQKDAFLYDHERLALAQALISSIGNLKFGPEVGVGKIKNDTEVIDTWMRSMHTIIADLRILQAVNHADTSVYYHDSRQLSSILAPNSIDAVFTSPPYPNEKDYTRTTRLESVLLGFINTKKDLREVKHSLISSNSRNVYVDDTDDKWVDAFPEIIELAEKIERRRIELNKTSGFEKLYARVTKLFFGGMVRHLADLRAILRPGAMLGYVVGDQASFFQIMIRTGQHIAHIAETLGYEVVNIDLFRTRLSTATQSSLREEVVILRWPGTLETRERVQELEMKDHDQYEKNLFGEDLNEADDDETEMDDIEESSDMVKESSSLKKRENRYTKIIERIFFKEYTEGNTKVTFAREDINLTADEIKVKRIKNLGDLNYSFRYRNILPDSIRSKAPEGLAWIIRPVGRSQYSFELIDEELANIRPKRSLIETKIPDATPGIVAMYAKGDEQALLTKLRYNRLIDTFTGVTCYSLQNHLRTTVPNMGQVETDEIYIGVDKRGAHYVFPIQAKGGTDKLGIVQIEQDYALCTHRFPEHTKCRPIAAQFMDKDLIALFEFENTDKGMRMANERHYRLVPIEEMTPADLRAYASRTITD